MLHSLFISLFVSCSTSNDEAVYVATVVVDGNGKSVAYETVGPEFAIQAHAIQTPFPSTRYQDLSPFANSVQGWGSTEAEAVSNASNRLDRIMTIRRMAAQRELMWLFRHKTDLSNDPSIVGDPIGYYVTDHEPSSYQTHSEELALTLARHLFWLSTHHDRVRVSSVQTQPAGLVTARLNSVEQSAIDSRCNSSSVSITTMTRTGTGIDTLVDHICEQAMAVNLIMGFEVSATVAAEAKETIFGTALARSEECYLKCLMDIVVESAESETISSATRRETRQSHSSMASWDSSY